MMRRLLRTAAATILYFVGMVLFRAGCACGEASARLWVVDHRELPPDDDDDDAVDGLLDQIAREEPEERRTLH
jgi:hypothetical protein